MLTPEQQTGFCIHKCNRKEDDCYGENGKSVRWVEERRVTHVAENGSQWSYMARMGVVVVACPVFEQEVEGLLCQASISCDRLVFNGREFVFGKNEDATVKTEGSETCLQRPRFGLVGVFPSFNSFQETIEREVLYPEIRGTSRVMFPTPANWVEIDLKVEA